MAPKESKAAKAEKEKAAKLAKRQQEAEDAFMAADIDGGGTVDAKELEGLLINLLRKEDIKVETKVVHEFVTAEFAKADTDGSGDVDFDEFAGYYNGLLDRIQGGEMSKAVEEAKKETLKKMELAAIAEDDEVFAGLYGVVAMLSAPSVHEYTGLVVPFKLKDRNADCTPNPEHGSTSHGIVLDLSRRAQRLLTPWGSLPLGYRLAFDGYQEKNPPKEVEEDKKAKSGAGRAKKPSVPWPLVPSKVLGDGEIDGLVTEKQPIFFLMARPQPRAPPGAEPPKPKLMQLKKLPQRCHYQVCSVLGTDLPTGEAVAVSEAAALKKLSERWAAMLKKYPKDPQPVLPGEDSDGGPMVNLLVQKTLAVRNDRLENLKKRKEVTQKTGNKKFPEADLYRAMLQCHNDDSDAAKLLTRMQANENTVLDRRKGHATRDMVRYALQTCDNDADMAEYMLKHQEKKLSKHTDNIFAQRGMSAIGYPSRQDIERRLIIKAHEKTPALDMEEGPVLAELKREWKFDIEAMVEIIAAAEVEEMLTPERCESYAFSRPLTAEDAQHVETLYLSDEFGRNKDAVNAFLSEAGTVLKRSATLGAPSRGEVEGLLRKLSNDSEQVLAFLTATSNLFDASTKCGSQQMNFPTREDCQRYLWQSQRDEPTAKELMTTIWKLCNPKAPKPPPKGSKKPPQEHYSEILGFPSREECEWALLGTKDKKGAILIGEAVKLLTSLKELYDLKQDGKWVTCVREDFVWALDPERVQIITKVRPLSLDEYKEIGGVPQMMLNSIDQLTLSSKASGVSTAKSDILAALTKLKFNVDESERWLNGVGTLMSRQAELGIVSREEVEQAMEYHELDDAKVIQLFTETASLQKRKHEIGNPSRAEIQAMLTQAWDKEAAREDIAGKCLGLYRKLMTDDAQLATLFGATLEEAERLYLRSAILRFEGNDETAMAYLNKVAEIERMGESLGNPSREEIIARLDEHGLDMRKAKTAIREEYHKRRDLQLKEEYAKKRQEKAPS